MRKKLSLLFLFIFIATTLCLSLEVSAANIGEKLPSPETGWIRFDDTDSNVLYEGTWYLGSHNQYYNTKQHFTYSGKVSFNFTGSRIRIIGQLHNTNNPIIKINIDGAIETYTIKSNNNSITQALVYESNMLENKEHYISIETQLQAGIIFNFDAIDLDENGELRPYNTSPQEIPSSPLNLQAIGGDGKVTLSWDSVNLTSGYSIKRSLTQGGPYEVIESNISDTTYLDTAVDNGNTYYYIVTAVRGNLESVGSNEASATPLAPSLPGVEGNRGILIVTMISGAQKEYDLSAAEIGLFLEWYNARDGKVAGTKAYFTITKNYNIKPFLFRKDYIVFDKIQDFEIKAYNE